MSGLGGVRAGGVVTVLATVIIIGARVFLIHNAVSHHSYDYIAQQVRPADPSSPESAWLFFATTDDATQTRTLHATLSALALTGSGAAAPAGRPVSNTLELRAVSAANQTVLIGLGAVGKEACTGIDHIDAIFDRVAPERFDVAAQWDAGKCQLSVTPVGGFIQKLLNAQTLVLRPPGSGSSLPAAAWNVAGLSWNPG